MQPRVRLPVIDRLWREILGAISLQEPNDMVLELAAGSGSVSHHLASLPHLSSRTSVVFDAAIDALLMTRNGERPVVGDLRAMPFAKRCAGLLTSQFGVEYAGMASLVESLDYVAPGGYFAFVLHAENGVIYRECAMAESLVSRFLETHFLESAERLLCAILERADDAERRAATHTFRQALSGAEEILLDAPEGQGRDTLLRVYNVVADMVETPEAFNLEDVVKWFVSTGAELASYRERLSQMQSAALSEKELLKFTAVARASGFRILRQGPVMDGSLAGSSFPVAFHVVGCRAGEATL